MNEGINPHSTTINDGYRVPSDLELLKRQVDAGYRRVAKKYGWPDVTIDDTRNLEIVKANAAKRKRAQKITL